jgi:hypothetical protein
MEVKAWFGSNFHMKGMLNLPLLWEWKYIENVLKVVFLWKISNLSSTFDKGNDTL